jgi:hypothetical protein
MTPPLACCDIFPNIGDEIDSTLEKGILKAARRSEEVDSLSREG